MAKILMLSHNTIPDARVEKEAQTLRSVGHQVFLVTPKIRNEKAKASFDEVFTFPYSARHYFYKPILRKVLAFHSKIIDEKKIEIIHAHNAITVNIALFLVKKHNLKLVFDDHETWTLWTKLRIKAGIGFRKILRWIIYQRVKRIERRVAKVADHIIVTNVKCVAFFHEKYNVPKSKLTSVENIALRSEIQEAVGHKELIIDFFKNDPRKKIVHVYRKPKGKAAKQIIQDQLINRDFSLFIAAQELLDDWVLVLFGEKNEELEKRGVVFIDYMPRVSYFANVAKADVGINPLVQNPKTYVSSQNRIYEYAMLGLRIISTFTPLLSENFEDKVIWVNPDDQLEKLLDILRNIDKYPSGKELQKFSEKYSWEKEASKIIDAYSKIA